MEENEIKHEKGRYFIENKQGQTVGELLYSDIAQGKAISINSTRVNPDYRGKGMAGRLLQRAVQEAVASGKSIKPVCPYAKAAFLKNPEYSKHAFKE